MMVNRSKKLCKKFNRIERMSFEHFSNDFDLLSNFNGAVSFFVFWMFFIRSKPGLNFHIYYSMFFEVH